jgi:hypothetical protein
MMKDIKHFGIDICYLVFDGTHADGNFDHLNNNASGLKSL